MKRKNGYTLVEVIIALVMVATLIGCGFVVYAAIHFITKFW